VTDDELPRDPFADPEHPAGALDRARTLRFALLDLPNLSAVFEAVGALSNDECRMVCLELAMDSWFERNYRGG
jgi:hypothetical protein